MTRINCGIPPKNLVMQHLIAEHREIIRIPNTINSGKAIINNIPKDFRLGTGHVKFFYNKLYYLKKRYASLYNECKRRGYNVKNYIECFDNLPKELMNDYSPNKKDKLIVIERINQKLEKMKKNIRLDLESLEI